MRACRRSKMLKSVEDITSKSQKGLRNHYDERIIEFLREYFNSLIAFSAQYFRFKSEQTLDFDQVDSLVENHVFYLRQYAMSLFSHTENVNTTGSPANPQEKLLQLIIGSIFQELLRLKQYLYIMETHQHQMAALEENLQAKYFLLRHGRALVREAEMKLPSLMEELRELWEEANIFLHQWLPQFADNRVIFRFLFRNQILIDRAYGYGGFENLLDYLFEYGAEDGFYRVGIDYYRSSHHREAAECFDRLMDLYEGQKFHSHNSHKTPKLPKGTRKKRLREVKKVCLKMRENSENIASLGSSDVYQLLMGRIDENLQELAEE